MSEPSCTMKMRGRPVTHDEADASAQRLINSRFNNPNGARCSIPVRPDDDDIVVIDYIVEQRAAPTNAELLRLLERHHAAWVARDLSSAKDVPYGGTPLCMETGDAIERAKEQP